ncbi:hypothetical protein JTB14_026851 [Gonioctena quinquepunctata]|nr:hypothetical protein JTB14_026851 [Gonioctena quinquepunctata]
MLTRCAYGSQNDSSIFSSSPFGEAFLNDELKFPEEQPFPLRQRPKFPFWLMVRKIMPAYAGNRLTLEEKVLNL